MTGDELFSFDNMPMPFSLSDFWKSEDLLCDNIRNSLAQFILARATGPAGVTCAISTAVNTSACDDISLLGTLFKVPVSSKPTTVFCLYACSGKANPLYLEEWIFFVAKTSSLPKTRAVSILDLKIAEAKLCRYDTLKSVLNGDLS